MAAPHISLILPAYNEAHVIQSTVETCAAYFESRGWEYQIIVSADGDDGTREKVRAMIRMNPRIVAIGEVERRGKGRGIREAVEIAQGDIIGYCDADYKVPIEEFEKLEPHLAAGCPFVSGSRALRESAIERKQPLYRQLGSVGFGIFMHTVVGLRGVTDTQCGFKFFPREIARYLFRNQVIDGYMFDVEILYLAERAGLKIVEVPIRWRDDGDSRLDLIAGNIRNVRDIFHIRFARRPVDAAPGLSTDKPKAAAARQV
jgi:dolichyl-phosphate beta-glucosyltransferase